MTDPSAEPAAGRARLVAFHLPQFHPIPENDAWWGPGFTEWTNVTRARPLFRGHYQPHLPADLGFYDLRLPETRAAQAALARAYGLEAFCYYHYWFDGRRLLERPVNDILASGEPDFPFCLCWANEAWSRRWLGDARDVIMPQAYSAEDDLAHIRWLARAFADARYLRVNGRPLFLVYRPTDLPEPQRTTERWRAECLRLGLPEPLLAACDAHCLGWDGRTLGFDLTLAFNPQLATLPGYDLDGPRRSKLRRNLKLGVFDPSLRVYEYAAAQRAMLSRQAPYPHIPSVMVGWDNTPRRGREAVIVINSDPAVFERTLRTVIEGVQGQPPAERLVFVNAWNEWAEGNHLEPDLKFGLQFLEAMQRANQPPRAAGLLTAGGERAGP
ncbi:MAG: glycoside hydrolase family 99-like domain-containing protein [Anaerolineales bacterium]|nr:glycoside hydrolase family 99-like domain-containing protein [Anaerolineales bacterium]